MSDDSGFQSGRFLEPEPKGRKGQLNPELYRASSCAGASAPIRGLIGAWVAWLIISPGSKTETRCGAGSGQITWNNGVQGDYL